jgi:nicotinamidase/pyrazinamidase
VVSYGQGTALVVVDLQNDFADPLGSLYVRGGDEVVRLVSAEVQRASEAGSFVAYTQDWHPPNTAHFKKDGGIWPVHCVRGSWGAELAPGLAVVGPVVRKGVAGEDGYSGFYVRNLRTGEASPTELGEQLKARAVSVVALAGLATDYCVKHTALDALWLGYRVVVLANMVRAVELRPGDGVAALEELAAAGAEIEG